MQTLLKSENLDLYIIQELQLISIKNKSLVFSILLPGGMDPMNAAKRIKSELVRVAEADTYRNEIYGLADFIKNSSLDDFIRTIPNGQSKIYFTGRGDGEKVLLSKPASPDEQST